MRGRQDWYVSNVWCDGVKMGERETHTLGDTQMCKWSHGKSNTVQMSAIQSIPSFIAEDVTLEWKHTNGVLTDA